MGLAHFTLSCYDEAMAWWRFNQQRGTDDGGWFESQSWSKVMPGDVVQSRGTLAWRPEDLHRRECRDVNAFSLHSSPVLVIARIPGIPGEDAVDPANTATFLCLSRHGLIMVIGRPTNASLEGTK